MPLYWAAVISIHAAREGGDDSVRTMSIAAFISIHAAREGGDRKGEITTCFLMIFQSTPPVKAATPVR